MTQPSLIANKMKLLEGCNIRYFTHCLIRYLPMKFKVINYCKSWFKLLLCDLIKHMTNSLFNSKFKG